MTQSEFDSYRPPQEPRRGRRRADVGSDGESRRRGGPKLGPDGKPVTRGDQGDKEMSMVEEAVFSSSYYGKPIVKAPPWGAPIGVYLFVGGLAGGSGLLQAGAALTNRPGLRRAARVNALAALGVGTAALIEDLGRPERFLNMMRTVKPTSPMSLGSWILTAFGVGAGMAGAAEFDRFTGEKLPLGALRKLRPAIEGVGTAQMALFGAPLAAYTAVLLGDTAMPSWHGARKGMPFLFVSSASLAAAGAALVTAPAKENGPARAMAVAGVVGDLVAGKYMKETMHPVEAEPLEKGTPGKLMKAAEVAAVVGGVGALLAGRKRPLAVASGLALMGASALTRFGVLYAGHESAKDPRYTVEPQKDRLAQRRARGITDDSITTAG